MTWLKYLRWIYFRKVKRREEKNNLISFLFILRRNTHPLAKKNS
jgi:hypothetical protein